MLAPSHRVQLPRSMLRLIAQPLIGLARLVHAAWLQYHSHGLPQFFDLVRPRYAGTMHLLTAEPSCSTYCLTHQNDFGSDLRRSSLTRPLHEQGRHRLHGRQQLRPRPLLDSSKKLPKPAFPD